MTETPIEFDRRAENDVTAAVTWYDQHGSNVGDGFIERLEEVIERFSVHPRLYPQIEGEIRRALMPQYPYAIYYREDKKAIRVIAVLHTSRRPDYWKDR